MVRNNEGKIVDENGVEVFTSDVFKQLSSKDNLIEVCPASKFLNLQIEKAYLTNPVDARKFVEFHSSKLIDDNFSLASEEAKRNTYINNVICFLGIANGLIKKDIKNDIIGGVFPTKNDNSSDSMVPMYLCTEMLRAKCLKYLDTPVNSLDNYDVTAGSTIEKNSTLRQEFDKVISGLKELDYDKEYFSSDMSDNSINYLSICQKDPSGSVDIYAKCEADKCVLYVTQGNNINNIPMFTIEKKNVVSEAPVATSVVSLPSIPAIETPVTTATVNTPEVTANAETSTVEENNTKNEEDSVLELLEAAVKLVKYANKQSGYKLGDLEDAMNKGVIHYRNASQFKETPAEQLNTMLANQPEQQEPAVSMNAAMFK